VVPPENVVATSERTGDAAEVATLYQCECGRTCKGPQGLAAHRRKCQRVHRPGASQVTVAGLDTSVAGLDTSIDDTEADPSKSEWPVSRFSAGDVVAVGWQQNGTQQLHQVTLVARVGPTTWDILYMTDGEEERGVDERMFKEVTFPCACGRAFSKRNGSILHRRSCPAAFVEDAGRRKRASELEAHQVDAMVGRASDEMDVSAAVRADSDLQASAEVTSDSVRLVRKESSKAESRDEGECEDKEEGCQEWSLRGWASRDETRPSQDGHPSERTADDAGRDAALNRKGRIKAMSKEQWIVGKHVKWPSGDTGRILRPNSKTRRGMYHVQVAGRAKNENMVVKSLHELESQVLKSTGETYAAYLASCRIESGEENDEDRSRTSADLGTEQDGRDGGKPHARDEEGDVPDPKRQGNLHDESSSSEGQTRDGESQIRGSPLPAQPGLDPGAHVATSSLSSASSSSSNSRKRKRDPSHVNPVAPAFKATSDDDAIQQFCALLVGDLVEICYKGNRWIVGRVTKLIGTAFVEIVLEENEAFKISCDFGDFKTGQVRKKPRRPMWRVD